MSETLKDKVSQALQELPKDATCIAAFFKKEGIKGKCGNPKSCPIANFLLKKTGRVVEVGSVWVGWPNQIWRHDGEDERPFLPEWCKEFIYAFDQGKFPEIIE